MREILFRGYSGNKWVYGYLINKKTIRTFDEDGINPISTYGVLKETIGQYTGLKDKNGTKIFEGDIVRVYSDCEYYTEKNYHNGVVVFDDEYFFDFQVSFEHIHNSCSDCLGNHRDNIEVISNIHDNPELLEDL